MAGMGNDTEGQTNANIPEDGGEDVSNAGFKGKWRIYGRTSFLVDKIIFNYQFSPVTACRKLVFSL